MRAILPCSRTTQPRLSEHGDLSTGDFRHDQPRWINRPPEAAVPRLGRAFGRLGVLEQIYAEVFERELWS